MADLVKFFVGNQENLDDLQKIKGQLVIALDTSNPASPKGTLYYDYNATQRIKLRDETAEKAIGDETGLNIRNNYLTSIEGSRNKDSYIITSKSGSGVTKNTVNIPINLVGSSATSSKIFLLGATTQSNDGNNSYTNNNFYIESNVLNGAFKGNLTGNATSATKATNDGTGANINTTYVKSVTGAAGNGYVVTVTKGNGGTSTFTVPLASASSIGLMSTGTQTFAGNKTFTGTVILSKTNDATISSNNNPALIVGGTASSAHLELDASEIIAKSGETGHESLHLNTEGGGVYIGANQTDNSTELNVHGIIRGADIRPLATNTYSLGSNERIWKYVYANRLIGSADEAVKISNKYTVDTSNAKCIAEIFKTDGTTYQTYIGAHNTGGSSTTGSIYLIPYTPTDDVYSGTEGLYISKNQLKLDDKRVPTTNDAAGTVGSSTRPVYVNAGIITQCSTSLGVSITGNAATATRLLTARTINGTSFNGTANITTANWGTARTLTIGNSGKSVNGSGNVTWSNNEIGFLDLKNQGTKLDSNADLNNIGFGNYYSESSSKSATLKNCPVDTSGFRLLSVHGYLDTNGKFQFILDNSYSISYRMYSGSSWTAWYNIARTVSTVAAANKLATARTIRTNLGSTSTASFDGTANITPGITGTLAIANGGTGATNASAARTNLGITPANIGAAASSHSHSAANITSGTLAVARGGTGLSSSPSLLVNLGSTSAVSILTASPRPGITGILAVSHGGTGASSASTARTNLGAAAAEHTHSFMDDITGTVPVSRGGTGAWEAGAACTNLGAVTISTSQTITGAKIFKGNTTIQNNGTAPILNFQSSNTTTLTARTASIFNNLVSTTGTNNYLYFRIYSRKTGGNATSYYEDYRLPTSTANRTNNGTYEILTSKAKVTVAQGGTGTGIRGAQSGGALANLGCIYSTNEPMSVYEGMIWLKPVS